MNDISLINSFLTLFSDYPLASKILSVAIPALIGTGIFSFRRRPKKVSQGDLNYFADDKLLSPPMRRPAYSDRMAYVLAEMSALAYYPFEGSGGVVKDAAKHVSALAGHNDDQIEKWVHQFAEELLVKGVDSEEFLRKLLEKSKFELLETINVVETQAFVCRRIAPDDDPYVVVAFRGTEQKVSDWLTDARAFSIDVGKSKIHSGFWEALTVNADPQGQTVLSLVRDVLESQAVKDGNGNALPVFVTGHSLGGALALLTTKELASDITGACYTYGAPRVANYEYFEGMKTPVFRVVNSSDIVPRVPPGAITTVALKTVQAISWITSSIPVVSGLLDKLESLLDKLHGYRHHGDQRYLTDVNAGRFETVKLVSNPPAIDRIFWMWQNLAISLFAPVKSHGMAIYRKKLDFIANSRNRST